MKFCEKHWEALRQGVQDRGMWHLVPKSGEAVIDNMAQELQGGEEVFDPLMGAHWRIANRVLESIGKNSGPEAALSALGDPDWCPLCAVQSSYDWWDGPEATEPRPAHAADAQGWIDRALDGALSYAREQHLVADVQ